MTHTQEDRTNNAHRECENTGRRGALRVSAHARAQR
jgi:hypothetical protein